MSTKKVKEEYKPETIIQNCNFTGVEWDRSAIASLDNILEGVIQISKSNAVLADTLKTIAEQFKKLDVKFNALLSVHKDSVRLADCVLSNYSGCAIKDPNFKVEQNG